MKKLLIGTTNKTKFEEYKTLLKDMSFELVGLSDMGISGTPPEGKTIEETAILKAKYYFQKSGVPTLVDQGGLELGAVEDSTQIGGYWVKPEGSEEEIKQQILKRLEGKNDRSCKLHVVMALASPLGVMTSESSLHGEIVEHIPEKKIEGMPFNSMIFFPNYNKHYCDLSENEKDILSQRKHAVEKIKDMFVEISK